MTDSTNDLPDDIERLKAMLVAERAAHAAERSRLVEQNDRLLHTLRQLQRNHFGRKSERLSEDQLNLGLEDLETAIASGEAAQEMADVAQASPQSQSRSSSRAPAARGGGDRARE
jgi:transposase